jgi:hypothetical protein
MVAATFSRRLATPAVRVAKTMLAQKPSQSVVRPPCSKCGHPCRLDIAGRLRALDNPRKKVVVITDSPPSTLSTCCTGDESDCRGSTDTMWDIRDRVILRLGVTRLAAAPLASFVPPGPRARVRCAAALRQLRGNCWALIVPRSARRYRDQTGTYNRSSLRTACTTSRRLTVTFS